MSQEKVDLKKEQKKNRKKLNRKAKIQRITATVCSVVVLLAACGWIGFSAYKTYEQTKAADLMKTNFLHNMSDQMMAPVSDITQRVMTISDPASELSEKEVDRLVDEIQDRGGKITALLNQLISDSEKIKESG